MSAKTILCSISYLLILFLSLSCFPSVTQAGNLSPGNAKIDPKNEPKFFNPHTDSSSHDKVLRPERQIAPTASPSPSKQGRQAYIVYMGSKIKYNGSPESLYSSMLEDVTGRKGAGSKYLLRTYYRSFYGCTAMLTKDEAEAIFHKEGVVSVFPNRKKKLHTTRSWDFLGLPLDSTRNPQVENDIIVGIIDTGVWPESMSFDDSGFGPVPTKWKGTCDPSFNFNCNRKLIGARYFRSDGKVPVTDEASPRDTEGHGTHTASTAAGSVVYGANSFGFAKGTARGGVPSARIAVYKACWSDGCFDADLLAAFDAAIADGVDLVSISIGSSSARNYFEDSIAIGSFHAMRKGIFTSASAGNNGPGILSVSNVAPWFLSVAASSIDRKLSTQVILGKDMPLKGVSINPNGVRNKRLIYAGDAQDSTSTLDSRFCKEGSLNKTLVHGKIVLCEGFSLGGGALQAGASGMLIGDTSARDFPFLFPLPAADLAFNDAVKTFDYIRSQKSNAKGSILRSREEMDTSAPVIVSFSSRGPNAISPGILKPDISAPGVAILAAWSPRGSPSVFPGDQRQVSYNIISGTSMACPHAAGVAAYIKSFHPNWSPSAIKSAIMTSAIAMNPNINMEAEFAYGAGQINPVIATNPGLIYDAGKSDYIKFLCGEGYDSSTVKIISGDDNTMCPKTINGTTGYDLNYPSFAHFVINSDTFNKKFSRTVTNVGSAYSTYKVRVEVNAAPGQSLSVKVVPDTLRFTSFGKKSYAITLSGVISPVSLISASIVWDDGTHQVRSPIVVFRLN